MLARKLEELKQLQLHAEAKHQSDKDKMNENFIKHLEEMSKKSLNRQQLIEKKLTSDISLFAAMQEEFKAA